MIDKPLTCNAWLAYLDVYGFSSIVMSDPNPSHVLEKLFYAHNQLKSTLDEHYRDILFFYFSDSIGLVLPSEKKLDVKKFKYFIDCVTHTLQTFLENDFQLRGAITYGNLSFCNNLLIGEPVIKAATLEKSIRSPVVVIKAVDIKEIMNLKPISVNLPFFDLETREGGLSKYAIIIPYKIVEYLRIAQNKYDIHVLNGPPIVARAWRETKDLLAEISEEITREY